MANTTKDAIRSLTEKFVADLDAIWRAEALRYLSVGMTGGKSGNSKPAAAPKGKPGRKPGRPSKASLAAQAAAAPAAPAAKAAAKAPAKAAKKSAGKGGRKSRRDKGEIDAVAEKIVTFVKSRPNSRAEEIKKALGITGKYEWLAPIGRLLSSGRLVSTGQKRSTTYNVG